MRMAIDRETARRVAHLARIEIAEADLDGMARELSRILAFMDQLAEVDVEGVEPMTSVTPMKLPWREDVVTDGNRREDILANAPETRDGYFVVPKVVE
jgi:aspartyl-tRNA(Asn)/glutamyl-tRNA(Gln) amidotransferase subunit C